ncbi:nucleoside-triphosphate diphosphatase [Aureococcus anophagefferens]|nr:nucleoside-triphosphate diphosphatase [Aureococcus anophagefferens]
MLLKEALQSVTAIVLASGSPRRRELLGQMLPKDVSFVVQKSTFDEDLPKGDDAALYCVRTAEKKGEEVCAAINDPSRLIISADTVVVLDNVVLEKPADEAHAVAMLRSLSGRSHDVVTGCALFHGGRATTFYERTAVQFSSLSDDAIAAYAATGDPRDKAGGYGIQGRAGAFVQRVDGCYYNVVGFPLNRLSREIAAFLAET